ncbi:MAG TPA: aconitate hydratase AcnA [Candidatus Binataceae bacterium]|jgi:aconitate hydratase|nr:aconitate hydratase AcnA [Candidatus Binataceae bacterium]
MKNNSFGTRATLTVGASQYSIYSLENLAKQGYELDRLPYSIKVMIENVLRREDGTVVTPEHVETLARWAGTRGRVEQEFSFMPARVLLQDFTGVPVVADLAVMRDAIKHLGGDPKRINPLQPVDLVIDHSVQVDVYGSASAFATNAQMEFERNQERYRFLRWGQGAFRDFRVVPPDTGIVHQVNLEYLAPVVFTTKDGAAYPDTVFGTDSHTTMINGLGVVGWGVGGIEAEAAMLGRSTPMLVPEVIGFRLTGALPPGATATDLVLTATQMLRRKGVVNKFVEYFGPGIENLSVADRATLANMAPEYGATIGFFPVDEQTLNYLRLSGRAEAQVQLIAAYCKHQGLFHTVQSPEPVFTDTLELDLGTVEPSLAGPRRPQDRVPLKAARRNFRDELVKEVLTDGNNIAPQVLERWKSEGGNPEPGREEHPLEHDLGALSHSARARLGSDEFTLRHGSLVIAAITSCTNTSNPSVMLGAGLLAKKAVERGLSVKPWVKTSLAPGSKVVTAYLKRAGLLEYLERLRFNLVGYGCTTCIGNSGPVAEPIADAIKEGNLVAAAILSGNRNFEGRINPVVRFNYLASPPLVVAYALAGTIDLDPDRDPLGHDPQGQPVYLRDIWPSADELNRVMASAVDSAMFRAEYGQVFEGDERWRSLAVPQGELFQWEDHSTYVKAPPFFDGMAPTASPLQDIHGARVLAMLGDSVTTDHISPAGSIPADSPAGRYLIEQGVEPRDFNSYGARRGNHEVMMRGTFANIRIKNLLVPGVEGGVTLHLPDGERTTIFDAAERYRREAVPLVVIAGKEYGTGSSRDWAAKGTQLLGVRAVIAESFERIHRSNLVGMGVLALQFLEGQNRASLGLTGRESYSILGVATGLTPRQKLKVRAEGDGAVKEFEVLARVDTPEDVEYIRHGGVLPYVLRQLLAS